MADAPVQAFVVFVGFQQAHADQHLDGFLHLGNKTVGVPGQKQFVLQERMDETAETLDRAPLQAPIVEKTAGHPSRCRQQMQHVVAEITERNGAVAIGTQHIAERMFDPLDHAQALTVSDHFGAGQRGDGHPIGIRQAGQ